MNQLYDLCLFPISSASYLLPIQFSGSSLKYAVVGAISYTFVQVHENHQFTLNFISVLSMRVHSNQTDFIA